MDKNEIIKQIRDSSKVNKASIPRDIDIQIISNVLTLYIEKPSSNMQDNKACFEGWALILKRWLKNVDVKKIQLDWTPSTFSDESINNKRLHYNRFLFRVFNFLQMYPEWFEVKDNKKEEVEAFYSWLKKSNCLLNIPTQKATLTSDNNNEHSVEMLFVGRFKHLLLDVAEITYLNNQLPVGVFHDKIAKNNAVFTGGKSAIDIWGVNEETSKLCVFELKFQNIRIGIISELLFYLILLNEACCKDKGLFNFDKSLVDSATRGIDKLISRKFSLLKGYLLCDSIHPLIDEKVVLLLNEGLRNIGRISVDTLFYEFENGKLEWKGSNSKSVNK